MLSLNRFSGARSRHTGLGSNPELRPSYRVVYGFVLLTWACVGGGDGNPGVSWNGSVVDSAKVRITSNPAVALYRDTTGLLAIQRLATFAIAAGDSNGTAGPLSTPARILAAHGKVAVLDQDARAVDLFDPESGRWLMRFGREGDGPGEFRNPFEMFPSRSGLTVVDNGKRSLESFDSLGNYVGSRLLPSMSLRVLPFPNGEVLVWKIGGDVRLLPARNDDVVGPADSGTPLSLGEVSESPQDRCFYAEMTTSGFAIGRCTVPHVAHYSSGGTLVARHTIDRAVRVRRPEELLRLQEVFKARMVSDGIPESIANTTVARIMGNYAIERQFMSLARTTPDRETIILEQLEQELDPTSAKLHVLSSEGVYLAEISLPYRVVDFSAGPKNVLLMVTEDPESGERTAASYQLNLPPAVVAAGRP